MIHTAAGRQGSPQNRVPPHCVVGTHNIVALVAAVVFGNIPADEIKEFGVILGPLVALVSAATAASTTKPRGG